MGLSVLVLGGTTFFGKAIVEHLLRAGHRVTVFSRGQQRPAFWDQVEHIQGDRTQPEALRPLGGRPFDAVVDNIAYTGAEVRQALEVFAGQVGRYVLTSTAAVYYTGSQRMPVVETEVDFGFVPPAAEKDTPFWRYTLGKLEAERALAEQDAVPYTVLRPPVVLGPEDPTLRGYFYFQRLMDGGPLLVTHGGVQSFRLVYSQDLARGYLQALESPRALGQTYNLAQAEVIQLKDLIRVAARALGVTPSLVEVPVEALRASGWDYPEPYARMTNFLPDIGKAQAELGFETTPFEEWLAETARWYQQVYRGKDSSGYAQRARERAFARRWERALGALSA